MSPGAFARGPLSGRHVLAALLAFFGVMVAVNAVFVYFAVTTFNGVETPDAYRRGLQYNQVLAQAERQRALGWTGAVSLDGDGIALALNGRDGRAVTGMAASARLSRPATDRLDAELVLPEVRPGIYAADALRLPAGAWIADFSVSQAAEEAAGEALWRKRERLWLRP